MFSNNYILLYYLDMSIYKIKHNYLNPLDSLMGDGKIKYRDYYYNKGYIKYMNFLKLYSIILNYK